MDTRAMLPQTWPWHERLEFWLFYSALPGPPRLGVFYRAMLSQDVFTFLQGRPIAMVASRGPDLQPSVAESVLAEVTETYVVAHVPEHLAGDLARNVEDNGRGCVLVSRAPGDHRSVQLKGRLSQLDPPRRRTEVGKRLAVILEEQFAIFMPRELIQPYLVAFCEQPTYSVRLDIEEVYNQTPGPRAGNPLSGGNT